MRFTLLLLALTLVSGLYAVPGQPHHRSIGAYHELLRDYHSYQAWEGASSSSRPSWRPGRYFAFRDTTSALSKSQAYALWRDVVNTDFGALAWEWRDALTSELQYAFDLDRVSFGDSDHGATTLIFSKQLMPNLIVSYRHDFKYGDGNAFENDRISLEYRITRRLSVLVEEGGVANTGAMLLVRWRK